MWRILSLVVCVIAGGASPAGAQSTPTSVSDVLEAVTSEASGFGTLHYSEELFASFALRSQITTFPIGSSSGAFTYLFDPQQRVFVRVARTLGPWFAKRASTLGRARSFSVGSAYQLSTFSHLDGRRLDQGVFYKVSRDENGNAESGAFAHLGLTRRTFTLFGTYAVSPTVDIGMVAPFTNVSLRARVTDAQGRILVNGFVGSGDIGPVSSTGLGDLVARVQWKVAQSSRMEGSLQLDFRLPTGSEAELRGNGAAQERVAALVSTRLGPLVSHVNVGYTFRLTGESPADAQMEYFGKDVPGATSNELDYVLGLEWSPRTRLTVTGEAVGRYLRDNIRFTTPAQEGFEPGPWTDTVSARVANLHVVVGALGAKLIVFNTGVLSAHVLLPLSDDGLRINPTPVIGFEYGF